MLRHGSVLLAAARRSAQLAVLSLVSLGLVFAGSLTPASAALSAAAVKGAPTLSMGSKGVAVVYLQRKLHVHGTGTFNATTRAAVQRYEKAHRLPTNGVVAGTDWRWIGVAPKPRPKVKASRSAVRAIAPGSALFGKKIMGLAKPLQGTHYRHGGTGPSSFDCSGLVTYVFGKAGYRNLPRTAAGMRAVTPRISRSQVRVGDLVFVNNGGGGRVGHVAIYAGPGKWFEASNPSRPVGMNRPWSSHVTYGRVR